jgi:hypothetical protein
VLLIGDASEPQEPLREKIQAALASLTNLVGRTSASARPQERGETIVAALRGVDGIDGSVVQKLVAAGVVYVEQLSGADPKEVAQVSGLDKETVARIFRALEGRKASSAPGILDLTSTGAGQGGMDRGNFLDLLDAKSSRPPPPAKARAPTRAFAKGDDVELRSGGRGPPAKPGTRDEGGSNPLQTQVESEFALEEARAEATKLRVVIDAHRAETTALERQCNELRNELADAKHQAALRVAALGKAEAKRTVLERERAAVVGELERISTRLSTLESDRREAIKELRSLADDTAGLATHVTGVLDGHLRS